MKYIPAGQIYCPRCRRHPGHVAMWNINDKLLLQCRDCGMGRPAGRKIDPATVPKPDPCRQLNLFEIREVTDGK
jgi:hypothetical protein